jgi:hypothetical protein
MPACLVSSQNPPGSKERYADSKTPLGRSLEGAREPVGGAEDDGLDLARHRPTIAAHIA